MIGLFCVGISRLLDSALSGVFTVFDECQVSIALSSGVNLTKGPNLWTSNPTIIALSKSYFDAAFTQAICLQQT
jgi:hypothetical protein